VVAGVFLDSETRSRLEGSGIRDSKLLSDARVMTLARTIREQAACEVVAIGPGRYNEMYKSIGNLNRLLAWAHARVIENLLQRVECSQAISDQFGDEHFLEEALMRKGKKIRLVQRPRAESELSVAAASVVARAEFLRRLSALGSRYGVRLPKGAGSETITAGMNLVKRYGPEALTQVAKLHFRTTAKVLA